MEHSKQPLRKILVRFKLTSAFVCYSLNYLIYFFLSLTTMARPAICVDGYTSDLTRQQRF